MAVVDRDAAARSGVTPPSEHDHYPTGNRTLKVDPRTDMDPDRFDADGCWPAITVDRLIGSNVPRYRATCRNCRGTWRGWTEAEAMSKARVAHGDAP